MRVLIYGINYYPELTGIGKYTGEMAQWLVDNGYEVKVVTAPPYYPAWKVSAGYSGMAYRREEIFGAPVVRCPVWVPSKPTGLKRILHLASFALSSFPVVIWNALVWRPNLVFLTEPPLLCVPGLLVSAKLCGAKTWLHIQDFEVDAAFELGMLKSSRSRKVVQSIEQWFMKKFDRVSTISDRMLERLALKGVLPERQLLFENWVDVEKIHPLDAVSPLKRELGLSDELAVLLYSGNMGKKQGLELIIDVARELNGRKDLIFILCGQGVAIDDLRNMSVDLDNVWYIPLQPLEKLNELLNLADIHLLPQRADAEDLVMPSKLTNIMSSGKPVVATARVGTQVEKIVKECGVVVSPGDVASFVEAILELLNDPEKRKSLGARGREVACGKWEKNKVLSSAFNDYFHVIGI